MKKLFLFLSLSFGMSNMSFAQPECIDFTKNKIPASVDFSKTNRPMMENRVFSSTAIDDAVTYYKSILTVPKLAWMFENCFPNTLDTTVTHEKDVQGNDDTFVITGDINAMWLRDSGAQVWPYIGFASEDKHLQDMLRGVIRRQFKLIIIDPYANAFNRGQEGGSWQGDLTDMKLELHERKWEIDSHCYPIRLAYEYWKETNDTSIFDAQWIEAMELILQTLKEQQRKENLGPYQFQRVTSKASDTQLNFGYGNPVNPVGLIVSAFRPSDDATFLPFLVPSNFFAVTSLRKAAEILTDVNNSDKLANECLKLADEVEVALNKYAVYKHPKYGKIYAFEVDGYGNHLLMDDANVPSLLSMGYLGDVDIDNKIYQNTRDFVWSEDNPYFFKGEAFEGIGGPHVGMNMAWPMSIMMKAFTSTNDDEIKWCIETLISTDANTGFMHESVHIDDPTKFTRTWFAWQNTLFGELIIKLIQDGKLVLFNSIEAK